jgi:hypothetical protein
MARREVSVASARAVPGTAGTFAETVLQAVLAAGQQSRPHDMTGRALVVYWQWLVHATTDVRATLFDRLREAVATGCCGPEAWVPAILGEHEFELARAATREYLGLGPVSLERHEACAASARDWVRRDLALNRAAVFAALAERADPAALDALRGLRGLLSRAESALVIETCCGAHGGGELQEFLADWRERLA